VTIAQPAVLTISSATPTHNLCNGGSEGTITITAAGGTTPYRYSIDNGATYQNDALFTGLAADVYPVRVIDANDCETVATNVTITEPAAVAITGVVATNLTCNGDASGTITITASGGTAPYNYSIDGGTTYLTDALFSGLSAGTYQIRVSDANGCEVADSDVILTQPDLLEISGVLATNPDCNGEASGSITITAAGGTTPYNYSIDGGTTYQTEALFSGLIAGTYPIMVTDANGCSVAGSNVILTQPDALEITDVATTDLTCNGNASGAIDITAAGGTTPYLYSIDDGTTYQTAAMFSGLSAGTYPIRVTDANGCEVGYGDVIITQPDPVQITGTLATDLDCNGDASGSIRINATGGTTPYTYSINGGSTYQPVSSFTGLSAGTYQIRVADANGCVVAGDDVILLEPDVLQITGTTATNLTCNGDASGAISIAASGGTIPYQYSIDGGTTYQTEALFSGLSAGTYPVSIIDANGCALAGDDVILTQPDPLEITGVGATDLSCNGDASGTITISATGGTTPYSYSIDGGATYQAGALFSGLSTGTYPIMVTDANGCEVVDEDITITEPTALVITGSVATDLTCNGDASGTITISATGGTTPYQYSIDGGTTYQTDALFSGLGAGTYPVSVMDANGCIATDDDVLLLQPDALQITGVVATDLTCNGDASGAITISATGGTAPYNYSIDGGITYYPDALFTELDAGTYSIMVTDANGCEVTDSDVVLTQPSALEVTDVVTTDLACISDIDGTITITAAGGTPPYSYSIDGGVTYQTEALFSGLSAGTYPIRVTDDNGCEADGGDAIITQPDPLVIDVVANGPTCHSDANGTITITASGGTAPYSYSIDGGTTLQADGLFSGLDIGTYVIQVIDANGCTVTGDDVIITQPDPLVISNVANTNPTCNGEANGTIMISVQGGTTPYNYSIDNGATYHADAEFTGLDIGTYSIYVSDANGCEITADDVTLTQPDVLVVTVDSKTDLLCNGDEDGIISLSATGGTEPYEFSIDNMMTQTTDNVFTELSAGDYEVFVIDSADCFATAGTVEITQPDTLKIFIVSQTDITPSADGFVEMGASGGVPPYTFTLQPNGTVQSTGTFTFSEGEEGIYTVELVDDNNCGPKVRSIQIFYVTSITENMLAEGVVYPNPSRGIVTIEMHTEKTEVLMEIVSIDGKVLQQQRVFSVAGKIQETLDLSDLNKGVYMIRMDNKTLTTGVVLQ
jgi:hypothetical protein